MAGGLTCVGAIAGASAAAAALSARALARSWAALPGSPRVGFARTFFSATPAASRKRWTRSVAWAP